MNEIGNKVDVPFGKLLTRISEGIYFLAVSGERIPLSRTVSWLEMLEEDPGLFAGGRAEFGDGHSSPADQPVWLFNLFIYLVLNMTHALRSDSTRTPHLICSMLLLHLYRKNYIPGATEFHLIPIQFISNYLGSTGEVLKCSLFRIERWRQPAFFQREMQNIRWQEAMRHPTITWLLLGKSIQGTRFRVTGALWDKHQENPLERWVAHDVLDEAAGHDQSES